MFVILSTANFKFRNRSTCSKGLMKRVGKVCGDSQDLKSPGMLGKLSKTVHRCYDTGIMLNVHSNHLKRSEEKPVATVSANAEGSCKTFVD